MTTWHDDEKFWEHFAPILLDPKRVEDADTEVAQIVELTRLPDGAAVLDMGCGLGRHSLAFARRGFNVTGVDFSSDYVQCAQQAAQEAGLTATFLQGDMRTYAHDKPFDLVASLFTSFGFFTDPEDDFRAIQKMAGNLKPGGRLIIDMMGKEILARIFRPRDWYRASDGSIWIEERELADDWCWVNVHQRVMKGADIREHKFGLRLYSAAELTMLLERAGLQEVRTFGSVRGTPYNHEADRLVALARQG